MKIKTVILFGIVFGGMVLNSYSAVKIQPEIVEKSLKPGKTAKGRFTITNQSRKKAELTVEAEKWGNVNKKAELNQWLDIEVPDNLDIKPGKTKHINYKVKLPSEIEGELMAMVYFNLEDAGSKGSIGINLRYGIPVYVFAKGTEEFGLEATDAGIYTNQESENLITDFSLELKNTGNVHLRPQSRVYIYTGSKKMGKFKLHHGAPVYPRKNKKFFTGKKEVKWEPGEYTAKFVVDYGHIHKRKFSIEKELKFELTSDRKIKILNKNEQL